MFDFDLHDTIDTNSYNAKKKIQDALRQHIDRLDEYIEAIEDPEKKILAIAKFLPYITIKC